jgi:hypothetical protein
MLLDDLVRGGLIERADEGENLRRDGTPPAIVEGWLG